MRLKIIDFSRASVVEMPADAGRHSHHTHDPRSRYDFGLRRADAG
jgi:hypothetical protein